MAHRPYPPALLVGIDIARRPAIPRGMGTHEPAATLGAGQSSQRREAGPPAIKGESTWQKAITAPATSWKRKCARKVWASLKTRWLQRMKRSEEHTSELQSLMRLSYAVFCLTKKQPINN